MNARCLSIALCGMLLAALSASAQKADNSQIVNGHMFVDLGLPSELLWASANVGAKHAYEDGVRFAWGETSMTEKEDFFDMKYYKFASYDANEKYTGVTKYNSTDKKTTLDKEDDAAHVNWGAPCRMPTRAEVEELSNPEYCIWTLTYDGYTVTSKKNGNSIFLNACGSPFDGSIDGYGQVGEFWTSTVFVDEDGDYGCARALSFDREKHKQDWCPWRFNGLPVRPVVNPKELRHAKTLKAAPYSKIIDGHRFVDLALPSKLLWAETNMGAETAADVGICFAWGETEMKQKKSYDWESYKFGKTEDDMTKYNAKDEKEILDKEDDAATVNWGPSCRIPDLDDFRELFDPDNCTWTWVETTNSSGSLIKVCKVTSVRNGNSIYLPHSGNYIGDSINHSDLTEEEARFWSRNVDGYIIVPAFCFMIISDETYQERDDRSYGYPIRPVAEQ